MVGEKAQVRIWARRVALASVITGLLAACSRGTDDVASSTTVNPTVAPASTTLSPATVPSTAPPVSTVPVPPTTNGPHDSLPPIAPGDVERVRGELADPALSAWIEQALTLALEPARPTCPANYAPMDAAAFQRAAQVGDVVTAELLLNLDATLGAGAEWCLRGDSASADVEFDAAAQIAAALEARRDELGTT